MINGDEHTSILGDSNSGKTTCGKRILHDSERFGLFCNIQGEDVPGHQVEGRAPTLRELFQRHKVVWNDDTPERMVEQLNDLVSKLFIAGRKIGPSAYNRKHPWLTVHVDEAWLFEGNNPPADRAPLSRLAAQGKRHGIILCMMTQRPQALSKTALRLARQTVLYRAAPDDLEYIEKMTGRPLNEEHRAHLMRDFHYLVHGPRGWEPHDPVAPL